MNEPLVSIIIPAYNAEKTIKKCIESLIGIDYPRYNILIIDDGSLDNTKNILFEYKDRIQIIESRHSGPSKCRNIAAQKANGVFLAFTDGDCLVDKNWIRELLKGFISERVVGVGGSQYSPKDDTYFGKCVQSFFELTGFLGGYIKKNQKSKAKSQNLENENIIQVSHNPSCNVMYRKDIFLEIGGFDEALWPAEDVDLDYRLKRKGFIFMYNPKAIVYHYRPQNFKELTKMMYRYGVVQGILTKRYGFFRKIQLIPFVSTILIILFIVKKNSLWLLPFIYLYILFKNKKLLNSCFIIVFFLFSIFIWNFGFLKGLVARR